MTWEALAADPMAVIPWIQAAWFGGVLAGVLAVALTSFYRGRR